MLSNFIFHIQQQYPDGLQSTRLPPSITHRLAYVQQPRLKHEIGPVCWHIEDSWCALQPHRAKDVFCYSIEIEAKKRLHLPVEIVHPDTHWQYALQGGYGLQGKEKNGLILTEGQHHQIYGRHGRFVSWVPPGRHIIIGYSISSRWLKRYHHKPHPDHTAMQQELISDIFYRNSPSDTTPAMLNHVLALLSVPAHSGIQLDTSLYTPIGKLQSIHDRQKETTSPAPHSIEDTINAVRQYIEDLLDNEKEIPSIARIAELYHIDKDHLSKMHKKFHQQQSLQEYISNKRLERAALLLKSGITVVSVTYRLYYHDISAFSNAFLKKYSVRPSQYLG